MFLAKKSCQGMVTGIALMREVNLSIYAEYGQTGRSKGWAD